MPFLSKTADNLGLIFAGPTEGPFEFFVELFGEGFADTVYNNTSNGIIVSSPVVENGAGGYTKLLMQIPEDNGNVLQIRPNFYAGGNENISSSGNVDTSFIVVESSGGDASGIALNDIWLAIAGGGGKGSYNYTGTSGNAGGVPFSSFTTTPRGVGGNGLGGYNISNPLATPIVGDDANTIQVANIIGSTFSATFLVQGASGGGTPGGTITPQNSGGGGGANIRIWYENNTLDGYLTSLPNVKMTYVDSADGAWEGPPKVVVSSPVTGISKTFTSNTDISIKELNYILEPSTEEVAFNIELFGEGKGDIGLVRLGLTGPCGSVTQTPVPTSSGSGGYTKLSMVVPLDKTISFQPKFYRGGDLSVTENGITNVSRGVAGDGAAFAIDGEWMAIAGGSSQVGYDLFLREVRSGTCSPPGGYSSIQNIIDNIIEPTTNGGGGVNVDNPTASPSIGTTAFANIPISGTTGTFPNSVSTFDGTFGSPGGAGAFAGNAGVAGKGNIRIYADTSGISTSGSIPSVPEVFMRLVDSADGFWVGQSKVVVTSPVTGLSTTFTQDTDMSARELKALLEPTTDIAFDIELFGEGIGSDPNLVSATFFGPPSSDIITPVANNSLLGGYTKLRVIAPIISSISPQPRLYSGGAGKRADGSSTGRPAAYAAAFDIDGEWMAIAGGSGVIKYEENSSYSIDNTATPIQRFGQLTISNLVQPVVPGRGGVNVTNPTASPQNGSDSLVTYSFTNAFPNFSSSGSLGGGGGGGAPGGSNWVGTTPAQGGGGNIRVWAETAAAGIATSKGDLTSVPGVYMKLLNSSNGTSSGIAKVVITSPITGIAVTYTNNSTFSIENLRSILYPGISF